jgi:acid phosphatase (class A)
MRAARITLATALVLTLGGAVFAQTMPQPYLGPERWPDAGVILPQPPAVGSVKAAQEQAVFKATRALEGSPRWAMAQGDVPTAVTAMYRTYSCALGVELAPQSAPRLTALMSRVGLESGRQIASVKDVFKRKRPYLIDKGAICVPASAELDASPDYPSGHSSWGWIWGLVLAELAPDRATHVLTRGRAYGDSRVVCGVHTPGAVEAGRTNGSALMAVLHGDAAFRADLEAARAEVAAARKAAGPAPGACAAESELAAKSPY